MSRALFVGLLAVGAALAPLGAQEPFRRTGRAFDTSVVLRAVGPDWDLLDSATRSALERLRALEILVDGRVGTLAEINGNAGQGPQKIPAELFELLQRSIHYCRWSDGRHGPLGAWLYEAWGLRENVSSVPAAGLGRQRELASCDLLAIDATGTTVELAASARLDLWGFERGFAVDRILDHLEDLGVDNVSLRIGNVQGARGEGPDGDGWSLSLPLPSQLADLYDKVKLRDESLAVASRAAGSLDMGGLTFPPYLDQQKGQPIEGIGATLAATETAVDAEALAATTFIAGTRLGTHLVAQLRPAPSILWWLGSGDGEGLLTDYRWSRVLRPGP